MEKKTAKVFLGSQPYRTVVRTGGHEIIADEPLELGGRDEGPTPMNLLLSALGACTAVTMRMYAERKAWKLGDIAIDLSLEKENRNGEMHTQISRQIHFSEALSPEQRERMLIIADKCPVHRVLMGETSISTT